MNTFDEQDDIILGDKLDAQRDIIRSPRRNRQRHRNGNARCRPELPSLHDRAELRRRARDDCDDARTIGRRLGASIGHRLSNFRRKS